MPKYLKLENTTYNVDAVAEMKKEDFISGHSHLRDAERTYNRIIKEHEKKDEPQTEESNSDVPAATKPGRKSKRGS